MKITRCFLCDSIDIEIRHKMPSESCIVYKDPMKYNTKKAVTINKITEELTIRYRTCGNQLYYFCKIYLEGVCNESETEKKEEIETEKEREEREEIEKWGRESDKRIGEILAKTRSEVGEVEGIPNIFEEAIGNETDEEKEQAASESGEISEGTQRQI